MFTVQYMLALTMVCLCTFLKCTWSFFSKCNLSVFLSFHGARTDQCASSSPKVIYFQVCSKPRILFCWLIIRLFRFCMWNSLHERICIYACTFGLSIIGWDSDACQPHDLDPNELCRRIFSAVSKTDTCSLCLVSFKCTLKIYLFMEAISI